MCVCVTCSRPCSSLFMSASELLHSNTLRSSSYTRTLTHKHMLQTQDLLKTTGVKVNIVCVRVIFQFCLIQIKLTATVSPPHTLMRTHRDRHIRARIHARAHTHTCMHTHVLHILHCPLSGPDLIYTTVTLFHYGLYLV